MEDVTMGNQQITPQYVAGLWDGEGTITITFAKVVRKKYFKYASFVGMSNTDIRLIDVVRQYCDSLKCGTYIRVNNVKGNRKVQYSIQLTTLESRLRFLESVYPYLISKKEQCEIAMRFLESRISKNKVRRNKYGQYMGKEGFSEEESILHSRIRELNKRGISETLRHPSIVEEDKVRTTLRDVEQNRNDSANQEILYS
jgi:hypothetical protein